MLATQKHDPGQRPVRLVHLLHCEATQFFDDQEDESDAMHCIRCFNTCPSPSAWFVGHKCATRSNSARIVHNIHAVKLYMQFQTSDLLLWDEVVRIGADVADAAMR